MVLGFATSDALILGSVAAFQSSSVEAQTTFGALLAGGIAGHAFAGPLTHWAHGHVGKGFVSLGMTLGSGALGAGTGFLLGAAIDNRPGPAYGGFLLGAGVGLVAANLIDSSALAYEKPKPKSFVGILSLAPMLSPSRGGLVVAGAF